MRSLMMLMIFAGIVWLVCYSFYSLGKRDAMRGQQGKKQASATGRKKVESFVVENKKRDSGDEKKI